MKHITSIIILLVLTSCTAQYSIQDFSQKDIRFINIEENDHQISQSNTINYSYWREEHYHKTVISDGIDSLLTEFSTDILESISGFDLYNEISDNLHSKKFTIQQRLKNKKTGKKGIIIFDFKAIDLPKYTYIVDTIKVTKENSQINTYTETTEVINYDNGTIITDRNETIDGFSNITYWHKYIYRSKIYHRIIVGVKFGEQTLPPIALYTPISGSFSYYSEEFQVSK